MKKVEIIIHPTTLDEPRNRQKGLSKIYVKVDAVYFPQREWDDFTLSVLAEWSYSLIEMIKRESDETILRFIDGRWAIKLVRLSTDTFIAHFGTWDQVEEIFEVNFSEEVSFFQLCVEVQKASERIINYMESKQYESPYLASIKKWSMQLKVLH